MASKYNQNGDPYWTTAKYDGEDANGEFVKKGTRIYYFPRTKSIFQREDAKREARAFEAARFDEAMTTGEW